MFSLMMAVLLAPVNVAELDNPYAKSVPCCGQVAPEATVTISAPKGPVAKQRNDEPTAKTIAAQARLADWNARLVKSAKRGKVSIMLTPAKFPEKSNTGDLARGMVLGELQTTGIHGLPDGKSILYVALVDGEHVAYFVHDGKIVHRSPAVVKKMDNQVENASVGLTSDPGEVTPVTICGRIWCVEIRIRRKK